MDAYEFCSTVNDLLIPRALLQFVKNSQDGEEQQDLLKAIASNEKCVRLSNSPDGFHEPISPLELNGSYPRNLVDQVFSKIGTKVTSYTCESGRSIVHFENAFNSP